MRIWNKRANFEYLLLPERIEAGISLTGGEAKAVRTGHTDLSRSYARVLSGEVYLLNANIPVSGAKYESTRRRKLLLHKDEILSLVTKMKQQKLTLVPLSLYTRKRLIKAELALGKPKRKFEKKEALKKKDLKRELEIEARS